MLEKIKTKGLKEFLEQFIKIKQPREIYIYSIIIGLVTGLLALLFSKILSTAEYFFMEIFAGRKVIHPPGETEAFFHKDFTSLFSNPTLSLIALFSLPILGGLVVGLITQFFYSKAMGSGTDGMIKSFHYEKGKIEGKGIFFKMISTLFCITTGGSGGREGPSAYIGAALGSSIASFLKAGVRARRTLLLAGAAGALGAIFRAPLGGALVAVEIIYREDIESDSLVPCIISSVSSYLMFTALAGKGTLFNIANLGLNSYNGIRDLSFSWYTLLPSWSLVHTAYSHNFYSF